jgi:hypothetical protein
MTTLQGTMVAPMPIVTATVPPQVRAVVRRVAVSLATAVVAPAALFAMTLAALDLVAAVIAAWVWMTAAMCWRWVTRRPVSWLLVLTLVLMGVRTCVMLVTGNKFVYFVQPVVVDAVIAVIFLGSVWSARPVVDRLAPDFYPIDATLAARPGIRTLFRRLTVLWGVVMIVKGIVTFWLLESLSTIDFVLIKSGAILTLTLLATTTTIVWSVIVGRQEGLIGAADTVA